MVSFPSKVEFPADSNNKLMEIRSISMGENHGALLTATHKVYFWGDNASGQLGLNDIESRPQPFLNSLMEGQGAVKISCGNSFTFLISGLNEIMISGKLPFAV